MTCPISDKSPLPIVFSYQGSDKQSSIGVAQTVISGIGHYISERPKEVMAGAAVAVIGLSCYWIWSRKNQTRILAEPQAEAIRIQTEEPKFTPLVCSEKPLVPAEENASPRSDYCIWSRKNQARILAEPEPEAIRIQTEDPKFTPLVCSEKPLVPAEENASPRSEQSPVSAKKPEMEKMAKNAHKAILEHTLRLRVGDINPYAICLLPVEKETKVACALSLSCCAEAQQGGYRPKMEDAHCFVENEYYAVAGLFDGHGGNEVSEYASHLVEKNFLTLMEGHDRHVKYAIEQIFLKVQKKILLKRLGNEAGSTAVICYIDKIHHLVYTATLGDSEANIYRRNLQGMIESIPLSCVRDWSSPKDAQRAAEHFGRPDIAEVWSNYENPKKLRVPLPKTNGTRTVLNVSRAFGNHYGGEGAVISQKPKIAVHKLLRGDWLVLACDGLKDFVPEADIVEIMQKNPANPARELVTHALDIGKSTDNVSVFAIKVE